MNKNLDKLVSYYRYQIAKKKLVFSINLLIQTACYILISLLFIEKLFFLPSHIRINIISLGTFSFFSFLTLQIFQYIFYTKKILGNGNDKDIGHKISKVLSKDEDHLINAIDLDKNLLKSSNNQDLVTKAISDTIDKLFSKSKTIFNVKNNYIFSKHSLLLLTIIVSILFFPSINSAAMRLANPNIHYKPPTPFELYSLSKNLYVIEGDSASISIAAIGEVPKNIDLSLSDKENMQLKSNNEVYNYSFVPIMDTTVYQAKYFSNSWISPWKEISTSKDTIFLLKRPKIIDIYFNISYPVYTKMNDKKLDGGETEINALKGSEISAFIKSNKIIDNLYMKNEDKIVKGFIKNNNEANITFLINDTFDGEFIISNNKRTNFSPPKYRFISNEDLHPSISVISPNENIEINETGMIKVDLKVLDDFGLNNLWIGYKIIKPSFVDKEHEEKSISIFKNLKNTIRKDVSFNWDISNYNLGPGDEIHFYFYASDNKPVSSNTTQSKLFKAYYPTLEDLFSNIEDDQKDISNDFNALQENIEDIQNTVEKVKKDLLKSDEVDWENQKQIEKSIDQAKDVISELENIQEMMSQLEDQAKENNLVSDELLKKFEDFQEMIASIITPEILEALEKMQSALESMNPQEMLNAMENFEFNLEVLEQQIDDMMNLFKMAMAEQKLDELIKNLEDISKNQNNIVDSLANISDSNLQPLSSEQRRQEERFKAIKNLSNEAANAIEEFVPELSKELKNIANSISLDEISQKLKNSREAMQSGNKKSALKNATDANQKISNLSNELNDIKQQFNEQTSKEIINEIVTLLNSVINISNDQELVYKKTKSLKSRSPNLKITLLQEGSIRNMNNKVIHQIEALSKKTFHISPQMAKAIGRTKSAIDKAISKLEQKSITSSLKEQLKAIEGLNAIAKMLVDALNEIAMGGGASGFDSFMQQMNQISQQQQGLNQSSMQLGKMGMMGQLDLMQQLQKKQEQLKNQLSQIMKDFPQQSGDGLSKVEEEMEDVIKDFRNRQFNQQTKDKQNKILSRLLDHQKSMSQRDYSDKRKSNEATEIDFDNFPTDLPADMGQLNNIIIQSLDKAMQDNSSLEYKDLTREYFYKLYQSPNTLEEKNEK